jgi:hypothetical protein
MVVGRVMENKNWCFELTISKLALQRSGVHNFVYSRSQPLVTPVTQAPLQAAGLLLDDDGIAVIRKNDHEEPVETRPFQAPLG